MSLVIDFPQWTGVLNDRELKVGKMTHYSLGGNIDMIRQRLDEIEGENPDCEIVGNAHLIVTPIRREPEYEHGAVYIDAKGEIFRRVESSTGGRGHWRSFGSVLSIPFDYPKRPLRKLVPESDDDD